MLAKEHKVAFSDEAVQFLNQVAHLPDEARLTTEQVAILLNCGIRSLEEDRRLGRGIPFEKKGKWVRYRLRDVKEFLTKHQQTRL